MAASATPPRIERRRRWSAEEKAALLVEVEAAGGSVSAVARRHRISESVLYNWRAALKAAATAEPTSEATAFIPLGVFGDTLTCESPTAALVRQRSQEQPALVRTAMYLERLTDVQTYANSAIGSMAKHDIAPNPQNFAIWYEYHTGQNADLRRMINVIVSNHREFDEQTLHDLYEHFFTSAREELALHGVSVRVQDTLQEVLLLVASARSDATLYGAALTDVSGQLARDVSPLATLIQRLVDDAHEMARRSERLGSRLTQSVKTIETLKQTLDDVRREAATDGLTGISNRRAFDTTLRETAADAMNSGDDLSILIIDIDHFKRFNDTWGHQTGDDVLQLLALTLRESVRGQDTAARYGGEEFAIILPATPLEAAVAVGNNIRRSCEKRQLATHDTQEPIDAITVSIGAACYDPGEALATWIRRADAALYRAKEGGRNCVMYG